jgi:hypothetical protein
LFISFTLMEAHGKTDQSRKVGETNSIQKESLVLCDYGSRSYVRCTWW